MLKTGALFIVIDVNKEFFRKYAPKDVVPLGVIRRYFKLKQPFLRSVFSISWMPVFAKNAAEEFYWTIDLGYAFASFEERKTHTPAFVKFSIYLNTCIFQHGDFFWFTNIIVNFVCRKMSVMAGFYSKTKGKLYISLCIPSALMLWDFELVCLTVCQWQIKTLKLFFDLFLLAPQLYDRD